MIKCCNCGAKLYDYELDSRSDCVGEFWGQPAYMDIPVCPHCRSEELEELEEEESEDDEK